MNTQKQKTKNKLVLLTILLVLFSVTFASAQNPPRNPIENHDYECSRTYYHNKMKKLRANKTKKDLSPVKLDLKNIRTTRAKRKRTKAGNDCQYTQAQIAGLNSYDLVSYLKTDHNYECVGRILFEYSSSHTRNIFTDTKIQAVCNEIRTYASSYDGTFNSGMYGLWIYLHVARYMEFFHPEDVSLSTTSLNLYELACQAMSSNSNLFAQNPEAYKILSEYLTCLDNDGVRHKTYSFSVVKKVMEHLTTIDSWKNITNDEDMRDYSGAYNQIFFLMFRGTGSTGNGDTDFHNSLVNDPQFTNLLYNVGADSELYANDDLSFIVKNAALELTRMAYISDVMTIIESNIAELTNIYPRLSVIWLNAVNAINDYGDCTKYNICENKEGLIDEVERYLFPNKYVFDDGELIIRTPLSFEEVQNLYFAVKQVQAMFFRITQLDTPVSGDINQTLNLIVFGDNSKYVDYAPFLYGITTNNGGMYIERASTFYTFDRESGLSLESLFRHEYGHYLQGRYWIPGYWGENSFYDNSRLTWYEEGSAEFFAGATDVDGVFIQAHNASRIAGESPNFVSLNALLNATYDDADFIHYRYGNALWMMWYLNDFDKFKTLIDFTRSNDITGFDNFINPLKSSSTAEAEWQNFLTELTNGNVPSKDPSTQWLNDRLLIGGTPDEIKTEFVAAGGSSSVTVSIDKTSILKRFRIEGTITSTGGAEGLGTALDNLIKSIRTNSDLNNFDYTVGYIKNVSGNTAEYVITGPLRNANIGTAGEADFVANYLSTIEGGQIQFKNKSTGYITGYLWNLPGAATISSTDANPLATYNTAGQYNVSLNVSDINGATNTSEKQSYIKVYQKGTSSYCTPTVTNDYTYIHRVKIANIDNITTEFTNNGYADYSSTIATELSRGASYEFVVEPDYINSTSMGVGVWVDWNQDGDFEDANEEVYASLLDKFSYASGTLTVPANAVAGGTRMRVRLNYKTQIPEPCGDDTYMGEIQDYSIIVIDGDISAQAPIAKIGTDINYTIRNESINFYNQSLNEPTSIQWEFTGGSPSTSTEQNPVVTYDTEGTYLVILTVENSVGKDVKYDYVTIAKGGGLGGDYCTTSNSRDDVHINNVTFNTINNSTGFGENGYSDFTGINTELQSGTAYNLSVSSTKSWTYNQIKVWIDWNQDGDFYDNNEEVFYVTGPNSPYTAQFVVPTDAKSGGTRMRVRLAYSSEPSSCGSDGIGETEDYIVYVDATPVEDTEAPSIPQNLTVSNITDVSVDLSWNASTDNFGVYAYNIFMDGELIKTVATTSTTISGLSNGTTYTLTVQAEDAATNVSDFSVAEQVTTLDKICTYCTSKGASTTYEWIEGVQFGTFVKNSENENGGYSDFTSNEISLESGTSQTLVLTANNTQYTEYWSVWIDLDKNCIFDDNELIYTGSGKGSISETITIPTALTSRTTMRVAMKYSSAPTACELFQYGEVEDYTIIFGDAQPVAPVADFTMSNTVITEGGSISFTDASTTETGSITSWSWTFEDGTPANSTQENPGDVTFYTSGTKLVTLTVLNSDGLSDTKTISIVVNPEQVVEYCMDATHDLDYAYISSVQLNDLSKSTVWGTNGFEDNTVDIAHLEAGQAYSLNVNCKNQHWADNNLGVWIDWNNNGVFTDAGEHVFAYAGTGPYVTSVAVPSNASGNYRMRIRLQYYDEAEPCGHDTYFGETEDYTIAVSSTPVIGTVGEESLYSIYPVPSNGQIYIRTGKIQVEQSRLYIMDISGRILYSNDINLNNNEVVNKDFSFLKSGNYIISIQSGNKTENKRFIIK